jgi:hypothetical protein
MLLDAGDHAWQQQGGLPEGFCSGEATASAAAATEAITGELVRAAGGIPSGREFVKGGEDGFLVDVAVRRQAGSWRAGARHGKSVKRVK